MGQAVTVTDSGCIGFIERIAVEVESGIPMFFVSVINPASQKLSVLSTFFLHQIEPRKSLPSKAKQLQANPVEHEHAALMLSPDEVF